MDDPALWIAVAAGLLSCFFGANNIALKKYSRTKLSELFEDAGRDEQYDWLTDHVARLQLTTGMIRSFLSLGILLAILSLIERRWGVQWEQPTQYAVALAMAAMVVCLTNVAIPVSWASYQAEKLIFKSLGVLRFSSVILYPLVSLMAAADPIVKRISGAHLEEDDDDDPADVADEVVSMVEEQQGEGTVDDEQRDMIEAVFEFPSITVGEIMTPRTDMKGIEVGSSIDQVKERILDLRHSRLPVYEEDMDHILGILYAKDLIQFLGESPDRTFDLNAVLREPMLIPESKSVRDLLGEFKANKIHIAIVLDEYGGTAGLITVEDIVEELVGDMDDEFDTETPGTAIQMISEDAADVDARVYIDDLNDAMNIEMPEDEDYDTVGGFVFSTLGHIPNVGETFDFDNARITVTQAERTKVLSVRVERIEAAPRDGNGKTAGKTSSKSAATKSNGAGV